VRSKLGRDLGLLNPNEFKFAWIVDFPMFEYNEEEDRWEAAHHMFTMPQEKYHATWNPIRDRSRAISTTWCSTATR
jgi:aspartyl-tRNA synthetase